MDGSLGFDDSGILVFDTDVGETVRANGTERG